ncbi:DUF3726 domain-containing protein [Acidocella aminolytica]|uniref:DUF3726 domain-containing protein n=1 Tax=Acidocella aminolytica 101 = DSM 11237 TaxID=1120923 RepID=A0A0D6PHZ0_9PROT|nr:DUF3726 domain-containing protein [Acidocella aminolytica]GAN80996.1 hypothetical protein Aam_068_003 [Acidocella aminolytica 101 = DSM 11237]GBQ40496.1 hypothetical protein AA11237_2384 [Acidocella aminolytica 101 = DSM 11237]SHF62756.1 Protein of unknown function [Acidocella aminolytica 101 = DSM 11237]
MTVIDAHAPTMSATRYVECPGQQTRLSRNEVEMLCLKAARGAGMPWGLAEEAGLAAGWLAARGVHGASVLLAHLTTRAESSDAISIEGRVWSSQSGGGLCPIIVGVALDDHAGLEEGVGSGPVTIMTLRYPGLVTPHVARLARALKTALVLNWDRGAMQISATGEVDRTELLALIQVPMTRLIVRPCDPMMQAIKASSFTPADICPLTSHTLAGLNALAMRTTVPASEQSRRDAGASVTDND